MNKALVTAIITVYNGEKYISQAIDSVLAQDYQPIELIVVNDCSSDQTPEIVKKYTQVKLLSHSRNLGVPSGRNTGIKAAKGEYIAFLDADDLWAPDKLSAQIAFHQLHPEYKYSFSYERFFYETKDMQPAWSQKSVFQTDHTGYVPSSMLFHKSIFDTVGTFNTSYKYGDNTDWIFRAKDLGYYGGVVKQVLLYRRIHEDNMSGGATQDKNLFQAVKDSMHRQRLTQQLVSVIIPVFNGEKYLAEAIESVIAQNYRPLEIIVIDDGSTDSTREIVHKMMSRHPIRYYYQENQGLAASRNKGISLANGNLIAFIDADDLWESGKLQTQIIVMEKDASIEMVAGQVRQFISPEIPPNESANYHFIEQDVQANLMSASLTRKSAFDKYGPFDVTFHIGQDMEWVSRAMANGIKIEPLQQLVYHRRIHKTNLGRHRSDENYKTRFAILKKAITRKHQSNQNNPEQT